jgi:hypothetical protein
VVRTASARGRRLEQCVAVASALIEAPVNELVLPRDALDTFGGGNGGHGSGFAEDGIQGLLRAQRTRSGWPAPRPSARIQVIPPTKGGADHPANLVALCASCHAGLAAEQRAAEKAVRHE